MVDEAHELSLATDTLLGLLKKVQKRRPELRLIISSATLEVDRLVRFFDTTTTKGGAAAGSSSRAHPSRSPAVLSIGGQVYPVQVMSVGPDLAQRAASQYCTLSLSCRLTGCVSRLLSGRPLRCCAHGGPTMWVFVGLLRQQGLRPPLSVREAPYDGGHRLDNVALKGTWHAFLWGAQQGIAWPALPPAHML
jgi:hypothetical protein